MVEAVGGRRLLLAGVKYNIVNHHLRYDKYYEQVQIKQSGVNEQVFADWMS